ncbi:fumarylacetoacetate hydrolase family protein [Helicobacter sp. 11S02629-2]|uniref:fumarylacetoacetate hydrolase family protein n=1 Tax=Helicobacter sp. 11S02629-2 TaxID=1476195 RepID=UPI000BA7E3D6|nr:fumarylacetoacetate hydrolase family protein [Helicobacter sp. 11S02629-2]PAF45614.1 fumarylacetoacetase [Helicobacter sp. 11S02629-2]
MKIVRFRHKDKVSLGVLEGEEIKVLHEKSIKKLIKKHDFGLKDKSFKLSEVELLAPMARPKQDVICLGINYMDHAKESAKFKKESFDGKREEAVYFSKRVNDFTNPNATVKINSKTSQLDYECELALIIGKDAHNIKAKDAKDYIFGYTIGNDISARDLQLKHKQFYAGKSLESSLPLGPVILLASKDENPDTLNLDVKTYVNGELRQSSNTKYLIFNIGYVLEELSSYFLIKAGSIILMGTPSGVGMGFNPPKFLKAGDVVKCEIEKIGTLTTTFS